MGMLRRLRTGDRSHPADEFVGTGDHVHALVPAQGGLHPFTLLVVGVTALAGIVLTVNQPWVQVVLISVTVFATAAVLSMSRYRLLALTDADIVVMRTRALRPAKPVELLGRVERTLPFEIRGSAWGQITVGSEKLWVHRRYHKHLDDADARLVAAPRSLRAASSTAYRAARAKKKVRNVGGRRR
ncbi:hypothetical protein [Candidatus Poriferisodalis sp.]|uniref:hypothetical protein n=1 Tax=Candidatus Poriferisodalis sp. TaxID=3101277 RepID=UPI003B016D13